MLSNISSFSVLVLSFPCFDGFYFIMTCTSRKLLYVDSILGQPHCTGVVMMKACVTAGHQVAPSWWAGVGWAQGEEEEIVFNRY